MIELILLFVGFALLVKGADWLVDGSSVLAKRLGVSSLAIGLTIVAFGTSMPELVVNLSSALGGETDVAFGNIVGSNIANILLILGTVGVLGAIQVQSSTIWKEIPFSLLAALALLAFAARPVLGESDFGIGRAEGIVLMLFFSIFLYYVYEMAKRNCENCDELEVHEHTVKKAVLLILIGLVALYFGGRFTVDGAVFIAKLAGISEYIIGLTIVAVGTSLPELVSSVVAAWKGNSEIAVGNVVGSNIFNIFFVLGVTSIVKPISIPSSGLIDLLVLVAVTLMFFLFMFVGKRHQVDRWQAGVFLAAYAVFVAWLILRGP